MRFSAVAIAAALIAVANARSAYFDFPPEGACVAACSDRIGKTRFPEYNDVDEYGPRFIESLSYTFESGTPNTIQFMMDVGSCMGPCPTEELNLYRQQFSAKKTWYQANKFGTPPPRPTIPTVAPPATTVSTTIAPTSTPPVLDPAFPFIPNGACVAACTLEAGLSLNPNYSEDPKSPYFWESMSYSYVRGSVNSNKFMVKAGTCMAPCPKDQIALYTSQYSAQVNWYNANKPATTAPTVPTTTIPTTTTSAPPVVTTIPPGVDPAYPFKPNGPCVQNCINTVGKSMFPNFSEDPKSPYFFESLSYSFESGSDKTRAFMTDVGMCQGKCPPAENELYSAQFFDQKTWYNANKPKPTTAVPTVPTVPTTSTTTSTTSGPAPTAPGGGFSYPFKPNGQCVAGCTNKVGKSMFPNYSEDPKSSYFIQSLAYTFESGSANTVKFMTDAGMCMGPCPIEELNLYRQQYDAQKAWYNANKNGGGTNPPVTTNKPTTTTTSTGPVPTGPVNPPGGGFNYPFKPNGQCVAGCTNKVGKSMFPNYSEDPKSSYFIQSLAYTFESGSANTVKFMTDAGMCMGPCPIEELNLYRQQYDAQKAWYNANKNGNGGGGNNGGDPTKPTTTTSTGPLPTGPVTPPAGGFDYPFKPNGACVAGCTNKVGKAMFPNYSEDPKSPYFIQSLAYTFESGSANTVKFMTDAGMCMGPCPIEELNLYRQQYDAQKAWYNTNKNGNGGGGNGDGNPTNPTGPGGDPTNPTGPPTGPITPPAGGFDYPFKPNGPCVTGCTLETGKAMFPNYSEDPKSPYFIQSLAYSFESGSDNTREFMTKAGMCMGKCPPAELELYTNQFTEQKAWYLANKNAGVNATTIPTGPVTPTDPITGQPTTLPGTGGDKGSSAVKFAASGLATLLAVVSALVVVA